MTRKTSAAPRGPNILPDGSYYLQGKSVSEMKAEIAKARGDHEAAPVELTKAEARDLAARVEDLCTLMGEAEIAFGFLARLHRDGDLDGHLGFGSVNALLARALKGAADAHATPLEGLVETLRRAGKVEGVK